MTNLNERGEHHDNDSERMKSAVESAERLERSGEGVGGIRELHPERWSQLDLSGKESVLREVGRSLRREYEAADPILLSASMPPELAGSYSGGDEFMVKMNRKLTENTDVSDVLDTYAHEYRHAYQEEMVARYRGSFRHLCHDQRLAAEWSANFDHPINPEDDGVGYLSQPIEVDARAFARQIVADVADRQKWGSAAHGRRSPN